VESTEDGVIDISDRTYLIPSTKDLASLDAILENEDDDSIKARKYMYYSQKDHGRQLVK